MAIEDGILERRPAGATHSFRLTPAAYSLIESIPKYSVQHRGRSAWVSDAIIYFGTSTTVTVSSAMGNLIFPNMAVASPEQLHEELLKLQARVEWWVRRCDDLSREIDEMNKKKPFQWITGILRRKKSTK
ncbi:MAG TPA: hypothetical protein EYN66_04540 [Myxococcales bacterium]|nr:hypothetical protein [Myxococcales bacterium]